MRGLIGLDPLPLQDPCPCEYCQAYEPEGCPAVVDGNQWGKGKCDDNPNCICDGIIQGIWSQYACEGCYVAGK